jgi:hypothetical protein
MGKGDGVMLVYLAFLMYAVGFLCLLFSITQAVENGEHVGDYYLLAIISFFVFVLLLYFQGYPVKTVVSFFILLFTISTAFLTIAWSLSHYKVRS